MTKSKTQDKLVSNFLTDKQLEKLVMTIDGQDEPCLFKVSYDKNPMKQYYTTDSDWDPVTFTLEFTGDQYKGFELNILVGGVVGFSKTTLSQVSDDERFTISKDELKLIKSLIKNFTDTIGNYVYMK